MRGALNRISRAAGLALSAALAATACAPGGPDHRAAQHDSGGQERSGAGAVDPADARLVADYFAANNAAAAAGSAAEQDFLRRTQHPDFPNSACELDGMALRIEPTMSTLRLDPAWTPPGSADPPRGRVYFVAVAVTAKRDGATVGNQIGYQHVVTIGQQAFAFAPCANR